MLILVGVGTYKTRRRQKSADDFMVAAGKGTQDLASISQAAGEQVEFMIIEFDKCETDVLTAIKESYDYLVSNGFAQG